VLLQRWSNAAEHNVHAFVRHPGSRRRRSTMRHLHNERSPSHPQATLERTGVSQRRLPVRWHHRASRLIADRVRAPHAARRRSASRRAVPRG
jgi:hypothetical protein